ncbi:Panacea domain-containing protein [Marinobacter shengliensis]|uniref:Panacea domain-containing protein n=1 Tax=Marinobacter shengliensis TaxID=1389223 RepID=UPI000D0E970E|nr:type II toxin-antitoxin system antitoxin SocA domain-containing protein [Marinobacter shengliensis]PSF14419.1 hypothetical protein C7H10_03790 [Marinobacter shengliensis]
MNIHDLCDYIIVKVNAGGEALDNLKLQKLMYYCQAWYAAFNDGQKLVESDFQAWVHGPVSREIFDRFRDTKTLYSSVGECDVRKGFSFDSLGESEKLLIDNVLNVYVKFSGAELEQMTHMEDPWLEARNGYSPAQRCEVPISVKSMGDYYRKRLN